MLADYRALGDALWSRFNAPRQQQLWYLQSVVKAVRGRVPPAMLTEPEHVVEQVRGSSNVAN
jgi:hypothetical protein